MKFKRSRNYCFTDFLIRDLESIYNNNKDIIRYLCWGTEYCPTTHKEHQQGWVQFFNPKSLKTAQRILNLPKQHFESMRGDEFSNDKYCTKDGKFKQVGQHITQGHRTDLEQIKKMIDDGNNMHDVANSFFGDFIRYHSGLSKYAQLVHKEKTKEFRHVDVELICGPTNSGKTRQAMSQAQYKIEGSSLDWWDGYEGESIICIDEYDNDVKLTKMLNILDGYQLRLPIKGGFTYANWNKVFITTNLTPDELHMNAKPEHRKAFFRRVTMITNLFENQHDVIKGNTIPLLSPQCTLEEMLSKLSK